MFPSTHYIIHVPLSSCHIVFQFIFSCISNGTKNVKCCSTRHDHTVLIWNTRHEYDDTKLTHGARRSIRHASATSAVHHTYDIILIRRMLCVRERAVQGHPIGRIYFWPGASMSTAMKLFRCKAFEHVNCPLANESTIVRFGSVCILLPHPSSRLGRGKRGKRKRYS